MDNCPRWDGPESDLQLPDVVAGLERVHQFIRRRASRYILRHGDVKNWHLNVFRSVVPLSYYAGNYRSDDPNFPCLNVDVQVSVNAGAPFAQVPALMSEFSDEVLNWVSKTDAYLRGGASDLNRVRAVVQLAAFSLGRFVQIHPFLDGNGRMSRMIGNYVLERYGFPSLLWPPFVRPAGDYEVASEACMRGDITLMSRYLIGALAMQTS